MKAAPTIELIRKYRVLRISDPNGKPEDFGDFVPIHDVRAIEAELDHVDDADWHAAHHLCVGDLGTWSGCLAARLERAEGLVREARVALMEAKRAMDRFDPRDCPHGSSKGRYDTKAQALVDAWLLREAKS